jgi:hypothetical protein
MGSLSVLNHPFCPNFSIRQTTLLQSRNPIRSLENQLLWWVKPRDGPGPTQRTGSVSWFGGAFPGLNQPFYMTSQKNVILHIYHENEIL